MIVGEKNAKAIHSPVNLISVLREKVKWQPFNRLCDVIAFKPEVTKRQRV